MKVLIVEDEARLAKMLQRGLSEEGHQADVCHRGDDALAQGLAGAYDAVVLDWSLPGGDGLGVLRGWRRAGLDAPVLMLTARGTTDDKVLALRTGADDYLVKPFAFEELLARLEALQRRAAGGAPTLQVGGVVLDRRRLALLHGGKEVALTRRELQLFGELAAHPGEVLTRSALLRSVWGDDFDGEPNVVEVYVGYLRGKLAELGDCGVSIATIRGTGYRLVIAPEARA